MTQDNRSSKISSLKLEIRQLIDKKKEINSQLAATWKKIEGVCGHPEVRITSWSTARCLECEYYEGTEYFIAKFNSIVIDVDGEEVAEKERRQRFQSRPRRGR